MAAVCPAPPNLSSAKQVSSAAAESATNIRESTGESFSAESGNFLPTPAISQQMMEVSDGTSKPAILAILVGACPTHCGFTVQLGVISSLPSASDCWSFARYALCCLSSPRMRSRNEYSATSACSLEQTVP